MDKFFGLVFIIGCVGIWYFVKKKPDKTKRNISLGLAVISVILILIFPSNEKNVESSKDTNISQNSSAKKELELNVPTEIDSDDNGIVTISGTSTAGANISVGSGIIGDSTTADESGDFTLTYDMGKENSSDLTINATLDGQSKNTKIEVKASEAALANKQQKEAEEQQSKEQKEAEKQKNSDITIMSAKPTSEQESVLDDLANQQFSETYPYKGSKMNNILGNIQPWTENNGQWYKKVEATIVNGFGAEQKVNLEIHITPESASSGTVEFISY